jgi:TatD DNase family protein
MALTDTHCHLDLTRFDEDRAAVIQRAERAGLVRILIPALSVTSSLSAIKLAESHPMLYAAIGVQPNESLTWDNASISALQELSFNPNVVAIGEIGLDYYVAGLDRDRQQTLFEAQLAIARAAGLPVILHVRKAHDAVLATLRRVRVPGGICHAFNGSLQQAGQYLELGFRLGFGGMLTYERSSKLRGLAQALPLEALVLETDAPDMTVAQHHGERNSPEYLPYCLAALAALRGESESRVAAVTTGNARAVLRLDDYV